MILALIGGIFAVLTFVHFASDWIFQTHAEAMAKHHDAAIRARHCAIYTAFFVPLFVFVMQTTVIETIVYAAVLFSSHFWEDTYKPVVWWMKHVRRHPDMRTDRDETESFKAIVATPLGAILMIAIDQIVHLAFLMLIAIAYVLPRTS